MKCSARFGYSYAKQPTHPTPFLVSTPGETNLCKLKQLNTEKSSIGKKYPFFCIFFKRKARNGSHLIGQLIEIKKYARHLTSYLQELFGCDISSVSQKKPWIISTLNIWLLGILWVALIVLRATARFYQATTKYKSEVSTVKVSEYTIRALVLSLHSAGRKSTLVKTFALCFSPSLCHCMTCTSASQHSPTISQN